MWELQRDFELPDGRKHRGRVNYISDTDTFSLNFKMVCFHIRKVNEINPTRVASLNCISYLN